MVKIQIEGGYLDVAGDVNFPLNFSAQDIKDISARKGGFSKTIILVGNQNNIDLLGSLYDVNVEQMTFNTNKLTKCAIVQNGIVIAENMLLQITGIEKISTSTTVVDSFTFTANVKDSVADFFTSIANSMMSDIDLSQYNHVLNATNVLATFSNTAVDGYKYFPFYTPTNIIPVREMIPSVYVKTYMDRMFAKAGKSYSVVNSAKFNFDKLVVPMSITDASINVDAYKVQFSKAHSSNVTTSNPKWIPVGNKFPYTSVTESLDPANIFNPTTGGWASPFYVASSESVTFNFQIARLFQLVNPNNATLSVKYMFYGSPYGYDTARMWLSIKIYKNGTQIADQIILNPVSYSTLTPYQTLTILNDSINQSVVVTNLNVGDVLTCAIVPGFGGTASGNSSQLVWVNTINTIVNVQHILTFDSTVTVTPSSNITGVLGNRDMNTLIPKNIKQSDFLKGLCTLFNWLLIPDATDDDKINIIHRDEYYDSGTARDWSKKLAIDKGKVVEFIPDVTAKKVVLSYKDDNDDVNKAYKSYTGETFGQVEYTLDNEYVKGIDRKEILFSPTPSVKTSYGGIVPFILGSGKYNIRLFLDNGVQSLTTPILIQNYQGNNVTSTTYSQASHFLNVDSPIFDINFAQCDYYLQPFTGQVTANNAYNLFWRRTMAQLNSGKLLTAYFNLTESDIAMFELSDKIWCDNAWWHVNRIIDYNGNENTLTKVVLFSVDDSVDLPPFKVNASLPSGNFDSTKPRHVLNQLFYNFNNVNLGGFVGAGISQVVGTNEVVTTNIVADKINGLELPNYGVLKMIIRQDGTSEPLVVKEVENNINVSFTPVRIATGVYEFQNLVTDLFPTYLITEMGLGITTETGLYLALEGTTTSVLNSLITEVNNSGNLNLDNYVRFRIKDNSLRMYTYNSGVLADNVLPSDIPFFLTLTFSSK